MRYILCLILSAPLFAAITCTTTKAGNWSDRTVWNCGRVPGDGDVVAVRHNVVIDQNIGSVAGGGVKTISVGGYSAAATLSCDNSAPRTIIFADNTGTTYDNAASDVASPNYFGLLVTRGAFRCVMTPTNQMEIRPVTNDGTKFIFIRSPWVLDSNYNASELTLQYVKLSNLGQTGNSGIVWSLSRTDNTKSRGKINIQNCWYVNPWAPLSVPQGATGTTPDQDVTFSNNLITGRRGANAINAADAYGTTNWVIENNTEYGIAYTAADGKFFTAPYRVTGTRFRNNAVLGNATAETTLWRPGSAAASIAANNNLLEYNIAKQVRTGGAASVIMETSTGTNNVMRRNVIEWGYQGFVENGSGATTPNTLATENFCVPKDNAPGQGCFIWYSGLGNIARNVINVDPTSTQGNMGIFPIYPGTRNILVDGNTIVGRAAGGVGTEGSPTGSTYPLDIGEGVAYASVGVKARNNLVSHSYWGITLHGGTVVTAAASASDGAATTITSANHALVTGDPITMSGFTGTNWSKCNGTWTLTVTAASTFTIPCNSFGYGAATGTIRVIQTVGNDGPPWNVGVHHNNVFAVAPGQDYSATANSVPQAYGWTDPATGNMRPHAQYSDMSYDPRYPGGLAGTKKALLKEFDAAMGGPGTEANLFQILGDRSGMTGRAFDQRYEPSRIWQWLMWHFAPQNPALWTGGHAPTGASYIGAVDPTPLKMAGAAAL